MEENIIDSFWDIPFDISWDGLDASTLATNSGIGVTNGTNQEQTIKSFTQESHVGGFQGLMLAIFTIVVFIFFIAQIVTYYRYCKKHHPTLRFKRPNLRPTTTLTFNNKQGVVRAHVYDPHRGPGYQHKMPYSMRRASASVYDASHSRTGSNTSEISYLHNGQSTQGSQSSKQQTTNTGCSRSHSSFSSTTVFMIDSKKSYRSALSLTPEIALDLLESASGNWSEGTMGHYSLSSVFATPPCHENPAFETDSSTTSELSSSVHSRSVAHSSSGASSVYRPRIPPRIHPYVTAATRSLRSQRSNHSESSTDDYEMKRSYDAGTVRTGRYRNGIFTDSLRSRNAMSDSNSRNFRGRKCRTATSTRSAVGLGGSIRSESFKSCAVKKNSLNECSLQKNIIRKNDLLKEGSIKRAMTSSVKRVNSVGSESSLTSVSSMSVISSFRVGKQNAGGDQL